MSWVEYKGDSDYEIYTEYPYWIRRKNYQCRNNEYGTSDHLYCKMKSNKVYKAFIIATQFIPNPNNYKHAELINKDNYDKYSIDNIRWIP